MNDPCRMDELPNPRRDGVTRRARVNTIPASAVYRRLSHFRMHRLFDRQPIRAGTPISVVVRLRRCAASTVAKSPHSAHAMHASCIAGASETSYGMLRARHWQQAPSRPIAFGRRRTLTRCVTREHTNTFLCIAHASHRPWRSPAATPARDPRRPHHSHCSHCSHCSHRHTCGSASCDASTNRIGCKRADRGVRHAPRCAVGPQTDDGYGRRSGRCQSRQHVATREWQADADG